MKKYNPSTVTKNIVEHGRVYNDCCSCCGGQLEFQGSEFGTQYFGYMVGFFSICKYCYDWIRQPSSCRQCRKKFSSRNKLFKHLRKLTSHQINIDQMDQTKVVCVKFKNIKPKYKNLKEWMKDENNIYIGRSKKFPKLDSIWANPFDREIDKVKENNHMRKIDQTREIDQMRKMVLKKYKTYILSKLESGEIAKSEFLKLKGKNLGCWCYPEPCHGDVLVKLIAKKT